MGRVKEYLMDIEIVVTLGLCSKEDVSKLSFEELDELILKSKNILETVDKLGICTPEKALNSYTYEELEKLVNESKN